MAVQSRSREMISAVRKLYKSVKKFESKIENGFLPASKDEQNKSIALKKKIVDEVANEYKIPFQSILNNPKAKAMLIVLFDKHCHFTQAEIADILKSTQSLISYRIRSFSSINNRRGSAKQIRENKIFCENGFMDSYKKIDANIVKFKNTLWARK